MALELGPVRAAYWLRTLSPWPEGLITIATMAVTKAAILSWRFGEPLSQRSIGLLFLSTLAGMCVAAAIAALLAYATAGGQAPPRGGHLSTVPVGLSGQHDNCRSTIG